MFTELVAAHVRTHVGTLGSMTRMETSWTISLSLVVASLTLSHMTAIVLSADEADDASWSSMAVEHDAGEGSSQQMPARNEHPKE